MIGRVAPAMFCDDKEFARLDGARYVVLNLSPGTHTFRSKDKSKGGVEIELKASETYYMRVDLDSDGYFLKYARMVLVPTEEAVYSIKQLKPINAKDVTNKSIVDMTHIEGK
ncbi:MAG: hypothetical protein ACR2LC_01585 [Pyrinomonadaceae bacterium]